MIASTDKPVDIETLLSYLGIGFKLIPLGEDGKTPNISSSTNAIYDDPAYWNERNLSEQNSKFINVATTYGKTRLKDSKDDLYLNEIDIDSEKVFTILAIVYDPRIRTFI